MIKATDSNGNNAFWLRILERFGLPTVGLLVLGYFVGWQLWPEHKAFLNKITAQQESQTEILGKQTRLLDNIADTTTDSREASEEIANELRKNSQGVATSDGMSRVESKVDRVHATTEEIKSRLPKPGDG